MPVSLRVVHDEIMMQNREQRMERLLAS